MPDEITKTAIDQTLIDGAVDFINRNAHASGLQLAKTISDFIVDSFFGGDFSGISSKDPHKTASFAALCEREDLQMPAATLNRLVRIGHQARHLPQDLAENLSLTHHRALLAAEPAAHKQHLARLAVKHAWTVEQLKAKIAAEKPAKPQPLGRPLKPAPLKWLNAVQKAAGEDAGWAAGVAALSAEDKAAMAADLQTLVGQLQARLAALA